MTPSSTDPSKHQFHLTSSRRTSQRSQAQRPPPVTTRRSNPSPGPTVRFSKLSSSALLSPTSKRRPKTEEEKFDMATGFLPFCATCEKQIMTPHSSILYCSQSCQNQDSRKPLSASSISLSPAPTPPSSPALYKSIIPPLEPTKLSPSASPTTTTTTTTGSTTTPKIPDHTHDLTSDLDPAEWHASAARHSGFSHYNGPLEGFGYFFPSHRRAYSIPDNTHTHHGRNPSVASTNAPPSLSNSPSSSPSSSPSPSPTLTHATPNLAPQPVTKDYKQNQIPGHYRPLPPLHKPSLSSGGSSKRGVELVMPQAARQLVV